VNFNTANRHNVNFKIANCQNADFKITNHHQMSTSLDNVFCCKSFPNQLPHD
jgi:hypothetical protein